MIFLVSPSKKITVSIMAAALAATGMWGILRRQEARLKSRYTMTTVLCARKFISGGKPVIPEMVEEVAIPSAFLPPFALRVKSELKDEKGEPRYRTTAGCLKGEFLSTSRLADVSTLMGLSWVVPAGRVAFTLKLEPEAAVGGLIQPGDEAHVYFFDKKTELLLPHARVAAVQDQVWDPAAVSSRPPSKVGTGEPVFVTLILTPAEAARLMNAAEKGKIFLALASVLDPA